MQLLRVLDDGVVEPLGSDRPRKVDIRLVCASNVDLSEEVRRGAIREDFYHRIMVLSIRVPPLRERTEDIPLLVVPFPQAGRGQERHPRARGAGRDPCRDDAPPLARATCAS